MNNKALKITLITLGIFIGVVILILGCVKLGEKLIFKDFYDCAEKEFKMPGASENLVQQGITFIPEKELFLIAGYMSDNTASMVYVVSKDGEVLNRVRLKDTNGCDYLGHTGGIEYLDNYVYITDGGKDINYDGGLDVFPLDQILNEAEVKSVGRVKTYNNPAYVRIYKDYMLVGEYYKEVDYETLNSHRFTTPANDQNTALINVFKIDKSNKDSFLVEALPVASISTTGAIQGLEFVNDKQIVLSSSWGLSKSKLYFYDMSKIDVSARENIKIEGTDASRTDDDISVKLYHLDSASLVETVFAPPMSEEMAFVDGRLYILNESACNKYIFGKFMSGNYIYSYDVSCIE